MAPRKLAAAAPAAQPTRRSTRLQEAASPKSRVTKVKAAPKAKPQKYDCTTCGRTLVGSSFPDQLPTDNCKHLINTCKACTKMHISVQLDGTTYDKLACPECVEVMANADVKRLAAKDVYLRYDEIERRGIASSVPGWRWCLNTKCRGGQVHAPLLQKLKDEAEANQVSKTTKREDSVANDDAGENEDPSGKAKRAGTKKKAAVTAASIDKDNEENILTCERCQAKACVPCDRPYHTGETCAQYKERRATTDQEEEAASLETIAKQCKQCPKCKKNIEKNGGCDAVSCTQCFEFFCFGCSTSYSIINVSGHGKECVYSAANAIDPHAMPQGPVLQGLQWA